MEWLFLPEAQKLFHYIGNLPLFYSIICTSSLLQNKPSYCTLQYIELQYRYIMWRSGPKTKFKFDFGNCGFVWVTIVNTYDIICLALKMEPCHPCSGGTSLSIYTLTKFNCLIQFWYWSNTLIIFKLTIYTIIYTNYNIWILICNLKLLF